MYVSVYLETGYDFLTGKYEYECIDYSEKLKTHAELEKAERKFRKLYSGDEYSIRWEKQAPILD